ncbi:MAG TPA: serine/threonine-protein kinase [Planctomycetaceae bacterium]|jgi:serine/threonine protein kinase|nr:serine/threonine-protein kinase [Planctomycetaceae bacterium]
MNQTSSTVPDAFLAMARRLSLLDDEAAQKLEAERRAADIPTAQLAVRHGLLDPVQIDIVETLLAPDDVVPGFQILDLIAQGGMGVVFRARQKSLDRVVALKTILVSQTHDPTSLARFEQEAMAVARLRHPNIVAAYDLGRHQGRLFFVMELIEGEDLQRTIEKEGPLAEAVAWKLLRQAAAGLSHAASAGIIHRDIKPANLLLVDPPAGFELPGGLKMVKITDFGLAFLTREVEVKTRLTQANTAIGSPHYLAPEQLEGTSFDHRVDIYSLGATAYHMLAGEAPFRAKTLPQIIAKKLATESLDLRKDFPHVSAASADLVRRMTERDPARRVADYAQLVAEIDSLAPAKETTKRPPFRSSVLTATQLIRSDPTPEQLAIRTAEWQPMRSRFAGRRKLLMTLGGGIVAASAIAVVGWSLWSARGPKQSPMLVPTGLGLNLFDGMSLTGWRTQSGAWTVRRNSEGGRILSGESGRSKHALSKQVGKKKTGLTQFSLSVVIQLHGATAAEIEFGADSFNEDGERLVARLEKSSASIGRRASDLGRFVRLSELKALPTAASEPHTLTVQRQPDAWWILIDESPVGTVPIRTGQQDAPWFILVAEEGEVWFSDITLQELAPPQPNRGS